MINSICTQCTLSPPGAAWLSWVGEPSTFSSAPGSYSPKHTVCFSCTLSCRPIVQCQIVRNDELGISERRKLQQKKCFVALTECKVLLVSPSVPGHPWALESSRVSPGKLLSEEGSVSCRARQNIFIKSRFLSKIPVVYAELELGISLFLEAPWVLLQLWNLTPFLPIRKAQPIICRQNTYLVSQHPNIHLHFIAYKAIYKIVRFCSLNFFCCLSAWTTSSLLLPTPAASAGD